MIVESRALRRMVIDAGPLIGAMYEDDEHHAEAVLGLRQLVAAQTDIIIPMPILFEVYKRLTYDVGPHLAHRALEFMQASLTLLYFEPVDLERLQVLLGAMPWWGGSLEDAVLAMSGLERDLPVWTYNYRDLQHFANLQFWTPEPA